MASTSRPERHFGWPFWAGLPATIFSFYLLYQTVFELPQIIGFFAMAYILVTGGLAAFELISSIFMINPHHRRTNISWLVAQYLPYALYFGYMLYDLSNRNPVGY